MSILEQLPVPNLYDGRSIAEINGQIEEGVNEVIVTDGEIIYPTISIDPNRIIKPSVANTRRSDVFMVNRSSLFAQFWSTLRSKGIIKGFETIVRHDVQFDYKNVKNMFIYVVIKLSMFMLFCIGKYHEFKNRLYPFNSLLTDELIAEFSDCADWRNGVVKAFKWHPKITRCAVALINDDVYIYSSAARLDAVPLLRHPLQKKITDLCFHPRAVSILAVSTSSNIIIWNVTDDSKVSRVSLNCARIIDNNYYQNLSLEAFKKINFKSTSFAIFWEQFKFYWKTPTMIKTPITSITFDEKDRLLASSPNDSKILIIDAKRVINLFPDTKNLLVTMVKDANNRCDVEVSNYFKFIRHGVCKLLPSKDGKRLLASPSSDFVRVYETFNYSYSNWSLASSSMSSVLRNLWTPISVTRDATQTACWSCNGRFLLLAFKSDPSVYTLTFLDDAEPGSVGGSPCMLKILDTNEYELPNGQFVGGAVQKMIWDSNSERLVISFKDNPTFIAVFKTSVRPTLEVTPIGYIHGVDGERPLLMDFHDAFGQQQQKKDAHKVSVKGSLLTVVWSSGIISNIPLQYVPSCSVGRHQQFSSITSPNSASIRSSTPRSLPKLCSTSSVSPMASLLASPGNISSSKFPLSPINRSSLGMTPKLASTSILSSDSLLYPRKPTLFTTSFKENM